MVRDLVASYLWMRRVCPSPMMGDMLIIINMVSTAAVLQPLWGASQPCSLHFFNLLVKAELAWSKTTTTMTLMMQRTSISVTSRKSGLADPIERERRLGSKQQQQHRHHHHYHHHHCHYLPVAGKAHGFEE